MTTDMFIMVVATNAATLILSTIFYITRIDELRRDNQRRLEEANGEIVASRQMVTRWTQQAKVLNSVPVSRLIGGDE